MPEAWLHFYTIILVQVLFFLILAWYRKRFSEIPQLLKQGILIGFVFGLTFDVVFGKLFGLFTYTLGFGFLFLLLNAALSYGIFSATVLLFRKVPLTLLFLWSVLIMAVYETANYFLHVYAWQFPLFPVPLLAVLIFGYFGWAVFVVLVGNIKVNNK